VRLNHRTWANWNAANPRLPNNYSLAGIGVGFDYRFAQKATASLTLARTLGDNPGRDANDRNFDGRQNDWRLWLGVAARF
jgi:hypothetical protein